MIRLRFKYISTQSLRLGPMAAAIGHCRLRQSNGQLFALRDDGRPE
jgi:hypothetical protein